MANKISERLDKKILKMFSKKQLGKIGEDWAVKFLLDKNYLILERNYCIRGGEIDIVAQDLKSKEIVFVEVKTRTSDKFGTAEEAVDEAKKYFLNRAAEQYLIQKKYSAWQDYRFDLIALNLKANKKLVNMRWVKYI